MRNEKAGKLYQNFTFSLPEICFRPFIRTPVFPGAGEGPALGAESDGALDLLSLIHNQFHFGETIQKGVGQIRSNLNSFCKVVIVAHGSFWNANPH